MSGSTGKTHFTAICIVMRRKTNKLNCLATDYRFVCRVWWDTWTVNSRHSASGTQKHCLASARLPRAGKTTDAHTRVTANKLKANGNSNIMINYTVRQISIFLICCAEQFSATFRFGDLSYFDAQFSRVSVIKISMKNNLLSIKIWREIFSNVRRVEQVH